MALSEAICFIRPTSICDFLEADLRKILDCLRKQKEHGKKKDRRGERLEGQKEG